MVTEPGSSTPDSARRSRESIKPLDLHSNLDRVVKHLDDVAKRYAEGGGKDGHELFNLLAAETSKAFREGVGTELRRNRHAGNRLLHGVMAAIGFSPYKTLQEIFSSAGVASAPHPDSGWASMGRQPRSSGIQPDEPSAEDDNPKMADSLPSRQEVDARLDAVHKGMQIDVAALKSDMDGLRSDLRNDMNELRGDVRVGFAELRTEVHKMDASVKTWMVATVIGLFIGFGGLFFTMTASMRNQPPVSTTQATTPAAVSTVQSSPAPLPTSNSKSSVTPP